MRDSIFLYLRPFDIDGQIQVPNPEKSLFWRNLIPTSANGIPSRVNIEELILQTLDKRGTLIGIGRKTSVIGSGKVIAADSEWRRYFEVLATKATCIISIPSLHSSTLWELEWLIDNALCSRVMMIFTKEHFIGRDERFFLKHLSPCLKKIGWHLPEKFTESSLFTFDTQGQIAFHVPDSGHKSRNIGRCVDFIIGASNQKFDVHV